MISQMNELRVNIHMHTPYSDGHRTHSQIAEAGMQSELNAVIVTDHNVLVQGPEKYYQNEHSRILLIVGEEIHDQTRQPQKNHLLVLGIRRELAQLASDTQGLIDIVNREGGLTFLAHPTDPASPAVGEPDLSWVDWEVYGYTGFEIWNAMSEFKSLIKSKIHAAFYAFYPNRIARNPFKETLIKWDEQLSIGKRIVAIGGSDAHALPASLGPIKRTLFPFRFHFRAINSHVLIQKSLTGDLDTDRRMILDAIKNGRVFIGYDLPAPTDGFRFTAHGINRTAIMGETISAQRGVTLQICLPFASECILLRNGNAVKTWFKRKNCTYITSEPGVYRVEVYINYLSMRRGWIFSNPIYVLS
jgi:hypothetical protein